MATAPDTDDLLRRTAAGDPDAPGRLLARHRARLRKLVGWRLDRRLAPRVDPSDVVQDVLAEASRRLPAYLRDRPLPFYPWLRQLAADRLAEMHRRHVGAERRSVLREEPGVLALPDESAAELAGRLVTSSAGPSQRLLREELRRRVQEALRRLPGRGRGGLVLRELGELPGGGAAGGLGGKPGG